VRLQLNVAKCVHFIPVCLHQAIATGKGPNGYTDVTILYLCYLLHLSAHSNFRSNQTIITGSFTVDAWWMPMLGIPVCLATTWGVVRGEPHQLAIQAQTSLSLLKMSFSPDNPDANGAIRKGQILTKAPELLWCVCFRLLVKIMLSYSVLSVPVTARSVA
jgi:hypothetical protein